MDQRVPLVPSRQDLENVKDIVWKLTTRRRPERPKSKWVMRIERAERTVRWLGVIGLAECFVLAILSQVFDSRPLALTVGVLGLLLTLLGLAMMLSPIVVGAPGCRTFLRQPFTPLFDSLNDAMVLDLDMVSELMACGRESVEYVLAHFKNQRFAFERRGMMLAGSLDRLGFFPTMVAFTLLIIPAWMHLHPWIRSFALLVPAFHFLNMLSYGLTQEMDRAIALIEYSLAARDRAQDL
jgi:hypothetical protein